MESNFRKSLIGATISFVGFALFAIFSKSPENTKYFFGLACIFLIIDVVVIVILAIASRKNSTLKVQESKEPQ